MRCHWPGTFDGFFNIMVNQSLPSHASNQEELPAKVVLFKLQCCLQYFKGFILVDTSNISISIDQTCKIRLWYFLIQNLKILSICFGNYWITKKVSLWKQKKTSSVNKIKNYFIYDIVVVFFLRGEVWLLYQCELLSDMILIFVSFINMMSLRELDRSYFILFSTEMLCLTKIWYFWLKN